MRVSTHYQFMANTQHLSSALDRLYQAGNVVSTGLRVQTPSDDPYSAALLLGFNSALASAEQYVRNVNIAKNRLSTTESIVGDLTDIVAKVRQIAIQGANATTDEAARRAMITEIDQLQDQLVSLGNRQLTPGHYLFAGQAVRTQPFTRNGDTLQYNGDYNAMNVEIQSGEVIASNVVGDPLFTDIFNALETIKRDLDTGAVQRLGTEDLELLETLADDVLEVRGELGALLQRLDDTKAQLEAQQDNLKRLISDHRDADMTAAIAEYQAAQTAYQAALTISASIMSLSLVDFVRGS